MAPIDVFTTALTQRNLSAHVIDVDYHRGKLSVNTDYIIQIKGGGGVGGGINYLISKTYSQFRHLASELRKCADVATSGMKKANDLSKTASYIVRFSDGFSKIIDSEPVEYLAKVSFGYVKKMAKERKDRLNNGLKMILTNFPSADVCDINAKGCRELEVAIEAFFLTDHVVEEGQDVPEYLREMSVKSLRNSSSSTPSSPGGTSRKMAAVSASAPPVTPTTKPAVTASSSKTTTPVSSSAVVSSSGGTPAETPNRITRKVRKSVMMREMDEKLLESTRSLVLEDEDDDEPASSGGGGGGSTTTTAATVSPSSTSPKNKPKSALSPPKRGKKSTTTAATKKKSSKQKSQSKSGGGGDFMDGGLIKITLVFASAYILGRASNAHFLVDGDVALLLSFVFFCLGYHSNGGGDGGSGFDEGGDHGSAMTKKKSSRKATFAPDVADHRSGGAANDDEEGGQPIRTIRKSISRASMNAGALLRKSLSGLDKDAMKDIDDDSETEEEDDEGEDDESNIISPLRQFPPDGNPDTDLNCTSEPPADTFHVRGPNYLKDKHKVTSAPSYIFPFRGVDLFLTDECPENVGRNSAIMGGKLRDVPTFLINFRLPWGILIFHFEIPSKFLPFLKKRYEPDVPVELPNIDDNSDEFTPAERCTARFLMGDDEHKKQVLKILPMVVIGPWIVKGVVGSKPAIIGNKLPVTYVYQPEESGEGGRKCYLEADLDIVASAAARKILSVVRSATQGLTIDLGFLCEGKKADELPEQMLVAARLHGLDPINASLLPPMPHDVLNDNAFDDDDSTV